MRLNIVFDSEKEQQDFIAIFAPGKTLQEAEAAFHISANKLIHAHERHRAAKAAPNGAARRAVMLEARNRIREARRVK